MSIPTIVIPILLIMRVRKTLATIPEYRAYWERSLEEQPEYSALRVVVIGDSAAQGIGASTPERGFVGLIRDYIQTQTSQHVQLFNMSVTGARVADVVKYQLPNVKNYDPHLILLSVSGNDANRQVDISAFQASLDELYRSLPSDKTVVCDVPGVRHREAYQDVLLATAKSHNLAIAPVFEEFYPHSNEFSSYAGDLFHPSDRGYTFWFDAYRPAVEQIVQALEKNR